MSQMNLSLSLRSQLLMGAAVFSPAALFSGGEDGAWYEAFDLDTLFQESTGVTPVSAAGQPVGLMYDKSEGLELGPEQYSSTWTITSGSSYDSASDTLTISNISSLNYPRSNASLQAGISYLITFTVSDFGGGDLGRLRLLQSDGTFEVAGELIANGENSQVLTANANSGFIGFSFISGTSLSISNFSVRELPGNHALQATAAARPTYQTSPDRLTMDKVDDVLVATLPAIDGTMVLATPEGTAAYGVDISAGSYDIGGRGGDYFPGSALVGQVIRDGAMTQNEIDQTIAYFRANGGGTDYGSVTDFSSYWRDWSELTSFPLIDTSSGTNFNSAWRTCTSLTSFPLLDTSSGTNFFRTWRDCSSLTSFPTLDVSNGTTFEQAWRFCTSLTTFPANMFDSVTATNFSFAFEGTNLSQTSIDNILVSINTANTSNGTFDQSGGSAPSATGEAAIDALRGRGWTVTVTGGY